MRKIVFVVTAYLAFIVGLATAQSKSGAIYGTVRDTSENLLPEVEIILTNLDTKIVIQTTTNKSGEYRVEVPSGSYALFADLKGFRLLKAPDLRLTENQTIKKDVTLSEDKRGQNPLRRSPAETPKTPLPEGNVPSR